MPAPNGGAIWRRQLLAEIGPASCSTGVGRAEEGSCAGQVGGKPLNGRERSNQWPIGWFVCVCVCVCVFLSQIRVARDRREREEKKDEEEAIEAECEEAAAAA